MSRDIVNIKTDKIVFTGPRDPEELKPLCLGAGKSNQKDLTEWLGSTYGYNSQGYIMPCCWTVQEKGYEEKQFKPLMKDKFHISNVDKIEDVIQSEEWKEFADILVKKPQNAANVCWYFCGRKINRYSKEHK